jgi:putative Holliday junction resolvase
VLNRRYIGLDFGGRRVGVAVSDPGGLIAQPYDTLVIKNLDEAVSGVCRLVAEFDAAGVVLGLPLNLSGDASDLSTTVRKFADRLRASCPVPIHFEDERLSSKQAEATLHAMGKKIKGNKEKIDRISAALILQTFLDRLNR